MLQTLYVRVLDECLKKLWLSVKKCSQKYPLPVNPNVLALIRSILPNIFFILLDALIVSF